MNLIAYSDSESDGESAPAPKPPLKQVPKPSFPKVVDRSNPGRIKVNLPGASQSHTPKDDIEADAPPAKKPRLGGASAFGGFNAMLPAPKKAAPTAVTAGAPLGKRGLGKGLAAGKNEEAKAHTPLEVPDEESKPAPKPTTPRFVPMSVGKGKKKKPTAARPPATSSVDAAPGSSTTSTPSSAPAPTPVQPARKPKVSLFGVSQATAALDSGPSTGTYEPMLYGADDPDTAGAQAAGDTFDQSFAHQRPSGVVSTMPSNDLTNIASDLQLSEAERRQLFGKRGKEADFSAARIVEFNTDTEYAHNEKLRQQGEQIQHNALKSISGTGKNSLRSLVSSAVTQKDALEEHFATGYRNKKEAGNKYGW
ncbi:hypothetical protein EK21DRAFT_70865 [Setomelanomma holmii]|uniref:Mitotic checkpoint regulator, MAD2B-interacting-domain-containing protein n=1 Tax=Setomelanomma holmii TaxID=210430 RepID=A0A9P4LKS6_9PLEO|nr:hypothetical protein EK21DRAFT_70865 [Setomelanomma holmii]